MEKAVGIMMNYILLYHNIYSHKNILEKLTAITQFLQLEPKKDLHTYIQDIQQKINLRSKINLEK